jgi:hypothetical protein
MTDRIDGSEWIIKDQDVNKSTKTMLLGILIVLFGTALLLAFSGSFPAVNNLVRTLFVNSAPPQTFYVYGSLLVVMQNLEGLSFVVLCAGFIIGIAGFFYKEPQTQRKKNELIEIPLAFETEEDEDEEVEEISLDQRGRFRTPPRSILR